MGQKNPRGIIPGNKSSPAGGNTGERMENKMKKSIIKKANKLGSMHITENPVNLTDREYGYKYFIEFDNTYKIVGRYKTQSELEEGIDEILENGISQESGTWF